MDTRRKTAQAHALGVLNRVESDEAYASILLGHLSRDTSIDSRDLALAQRITRGVLENKTRIDSILDPLLSKGLSSLTSSIKNCLRIAVYQILYLDRVPAEVAVNESVELAKRSSRNPTHPKLVNAILRRVAKEAPILKSAKTNPENPSEIAHQFSHPDWLVKRWVAQFGIEETVKICEANNSIWPLSIRVNTLKTSPQDLQDLLAQENVITKKSRVLPECLLIDRSPNRSRLHELSSFNRGLFIIQDESAALVSHLMKPEPGERIVDLCSAPGGKTTHLAALMKNEGIIYAVEKNVNRLALVRDNCERLGVRIVEFHPGDGTTVCLPQPADGLLLDAPCSGSGVIGRKSEIRWNKSAQAIEELHNLQMELLQHGADLVRPGGRIVYSTCSIEQSENEDVIEKFLQARPDFSLIDARSAVPEEFVTGHGYMRTWPHRHSIGGGFGAILRRVR